MALFDDAGMMLVSEDYEMEQHDWQPTEGGDRSPLSAIVASPQTINKLNRFQATDNSTRLYGRPCGIGPVKCFRRKEQLVVQQGELWQIEQGFVKALTWDDQGCVLTLGIWGPGDSVGLPLGGITPYEVLCMTPLQARLHRLAAGYPYEFLWEQAQQSQELLGLFRCRCIENRLLDCLWWLAHRFGTTEAQGRLTGITLTHQELADLVGSTRVTITRMLRQLEQSGKLERINRQFLLKDTTHSPQMRGSCRQTRSQPRQKSGFAENPRSIH